MKKIVPPLKFHGSKTYLADKIWELAPPHIHRVHLCGGAFNEGWNWPYENYSEVYNDIDGRLTNFFRVLQSEKMFALFRRKVEAIPFSQVEWEDAGTKEIPNRVQAAIAFFVQVRQSLAGRISSFAPLSRTRTRRGMNEQVSSWLRVVDGLPAVHKRLKRLVILNDKALEVLRTQDGKDTFFYIDPPYLPETRESKRVYKYEMSPEEHENLLKALVGIKGKFALSGYDNELYTRFEKEHGWHRREFELPNNAAGGKIKRRMVEVLWMNYEPKEKG